MMPPSKSERMTEGLRWRPFSRQDSLSLAKKNDCRLRLFCSATEHRQMENAGHCTQHVPWRADRTTMGWPWRFRLYRWFQLHKASLNYQLLQRQQGGFDHLVQCPLEESLPHGLFKSTLPWNQSLLVLRQCWEPLKPTVIEGRLKVLEWRQIDSCFFTARGTIQFCHLLTVDLW